MWINPNNKAGYRHKPNDFKDEKYDISIQCDVPRPFMSYALIMKALWRSEDYLSNPKTYAKDLIMGGILDVECFEFLNRQKIGTGWILK